METLNKISELETQVNEANTSNANGRNEVVIGCKALYDLVEKDYYEAGAGVLIEGMYNDLTSGNFAEPFMCERKKGKFELYATIYRNKVISKLQRN